MQKTSREKNKKGQDRREKFLQLADALVIATGKNNYEIAELAGVDPTYFSKIRNGTKNAGPKLINKMEHLLGVGPAVVQYNKIDLSAESMRAVEGWAKRAGMPPHEFVTQLLHEYGRMFCDELTDPQTVQEPQESPAAISTRAILTPLSVDLPVVITDAHGKTLWINRQFTEMCGYELDELSGKKPGSLLQGPETDRKTVEQMRKAIRNHDGAGVDIVNYHKNGTTYRAQIEIAPIKRNGNLIGFVAAEQVVTQQNELRKSAYELADSLSEIGAFERFSEPVSHHERVTTSAKTAAATILKEESTRLKKPAGSGEQKSQDDQRAPAWKGEKEK